MIPEEELEDEIVGAINADWSEFGDGGSPPGKEMVARFRARVERETRIKCAEEIRAVGKCDIRRGQPGFPYDMDFAARLIHPDNQE